jgi:hypothetical protein
VNAIFEKGERTAGFAEENSSRQLLAFLPFPAEPICGLD